MYSKLLSVHMKGVNMDKRQIKTRKAIFIAFNELLAEKSYSDITVQDIILKADIGRGTFYAHFGKKDDLLNELSREVFNSVFECKCSGECIHDKDEKKHDFKSMIEHTLVHIKSVRENFYNLFQCDGREVFMDVFKVYLKELFRDSLFENGVSYFENVEEEIVLEVLESAFIGILEHWVFSEFKLSEEELAKQFVSMFNFNHATTVCRHCNCKG